MGDLWSARFFFLATWWVGYFFTAVQEFFSITFVLHAIFFFRQALAGNCFQNHPPPHPPQELNGRPLNKSSTELPQGGSFPPPRESVLRSEIKKANDYVTTQLILRRSCVFEKLRLMSTSTYEPTNTRPPNVGKCLLLS